MPEFEHPRPPEMLMPVSDEHAMRQFEIEALRSINRNLERLYQRSDEQGQTLHTIDLRLTRIESNSVSAEVGELKSKVDQLESDRDRREGALSLGNWLLRNWPALVALLVLAGVVLKANGKL